MIKLIKQQLSDQEKFVKECLALKDGVHIARILGTKRKGLYACVGDNLSQMSMAIEWKEVKPLFEALFNYYEKHK